MEKLDSSWKEIKTDFKLTTLLGKGSFGIVIKGKHRQSRNEVAIKRIDCNFKDMEKIKYVLREITILRQLTQMEFCNFTPKLFDIVIPSRFEEKVSETPYIFLIMEYIPNNLS